MIFAQYDAECFNAQRKLITENIANTPLDSMHYRDTLRIAGVDRYIDTVYGFRVKDVSTQISKVVGCKMPDFSFFDLNGEEFSVYKTRSDFTIINFSFDCGDVCNYQLGELSKLKKDLGDSVVIYNIYELEDKKLIDYFKSLELADNMEFVANADLLLFSYAIKDIRPFIYLLDKYKNIIYVKGGQDVTESPTFLYEQFLEKMRATNCSN